MDGDKLSSADLIFQIQSFYLRKKEYNILYSASRGDVLTWWILYNSVHNEENYIQKLALKILAITPYNARFEKLEAMVKLYRYYITNAQKELNDDSNGNDGDNDYNNNNDNDDNNNDNNDDDNNNNDNDNDEKSIHAAQIILGCHNCHNYNLECHVTEIEKWVNINNLELKKLLNIEVNVVIELHLLPVINHGSNVFDVEATVDKILSS
ncbi:hypothetical protein RhiirB3_449754 [Rhizophagus irregularis]|nr:hypothetical protein RhiirB3_449754 [Rhizophagus irregularis]